LISFHDGMVEIDGIDDIDGIESPAAGGESSMFGGVYTDLGTVMFSVEESSLVATATDVGCVVVAAGGATATVFVGELGVA